MNEPLHFKTRDEFRIWLINHCMSGGGIWLKFEKSKNTAFKAGDALEEALCFGWIDGVMKRIDDESYIKYFSARRKDSKWSEKRENTGGQEERSMGQAFRTACCHSRTNRDRGRPFKRT